MNLILSTLSNPTHLARIKALQFALSALCLVLIRCVVEVSYLWFIRRAAVRIKSELISGKSQNYPLSCDI
jgi:hypothetical protein